MQSLAASLSAGRVPAAAPRTAARSGGACSSGAESSTGSGSSRVLPQRQPQQRPQRRRVLSAPAAASGEAAPQGRQQQLPEEVWGGEPLAANEVAFLDDDNLVIEHGLPDGLEGKAGYTPYHFIDFTDVPLKHELVAKVDRPVSEVYALWADRLNWPHWFGMIEEVGFREGDEDVCALNMWYRWAMTPWLELYVALRRTKAEVNKYIVEEPVDGAPIVAAVLFQEAEGGGATLVTLRISYLVPRVLFEFAGCTAVYGDVDRKLGRCMTRMKESIEGADAGSVIAAGQATMAEIRAGLPDHKRQQDEYEVQWAEEKRRFEAAQQRQQAAAAAAAQSAADLEAATAAAEEASKAAATAAAEAAVLEEAQAAAAAPKGKRGRKAGGATVSSGKGRRGARKPDE